MTIIADPVFYLFAIPAVILLGLSKGGFAGVGMAGTPLLALLMPPLEAAALLLPIMLLQDAISLWVYRRQWDAWNLKVLLLGAAAGIGMAWALAAYVTTAVIQLVVGLIGLAFVLYAWFGRPPTTQVPPRAARGVFWGALSGFTSTLIQNGGPPFYVFVLPQRLDKMVFVSTTTWFFAAVNLLKVVPYFALGQFSSAGLATSALLMPLAVASNFLGIWLVRVTPHELFYRITYLLIFALSLELTRRGIVGLM